MASASTEVGRNTVGVVPDKVHPARSAWIAVVLAPVGLILGVIVAFGIAGALDVDLWEPGTMTDAEKALVYVPAAVVWLAAPAVGVVRGVQSWIGGSRSGMVAATVSGVLLLLMLGLSINSPQG